MSLDLTVKTVRDPLADVLSNVFTTTFVSNRHADLYPDCNGRVEWIGSGACSPELNFAECGYDGGE